MLQLDANTNMKFIQTYAAMSDHEDEEVENFHEEVSQRCPDVKVVNQLFKGSDRRILRCKIKPQL